MKTPQKLEEFTFYSYICCECKKLYHELIPSWRWKLFKKECSTGLSCERCADKLIIRIEKNTKKCKECGNYSYEIEK